MARSTAQSLITQSVLDRLQTVEDWPSTRSESLRYFKDVLKRDLEWLLNTRLPPLAGIERYPLTKASVAYYGLPDISSMGFGSAADHKRLRRSIEVCLRNFEPRLMDIRVTIEGAGATDRCLRFQIEGLMRLDPAPEEIAFDTVLELSSGEYKVK